MKRLAGNLALAACGLLAGLLLLEGILRLAGFGPVEMVPDPWIGYRMIPHARYRHIGEGASSGRFNRAGWRDVDHALAHPPHTTRILFLGDSFVEALQVPLDSTFFRRLEGRLNAGAGPGRRFEVIAMGEDGNGTTAEYLTYERWGTNYRPDVVAVLLILNDMADNSRPAALDKARPFFVEDGDSLRLDRSFNQTADYRSYARLIWIKSHSALWAQLHRALATLRARKLPRVEIGDQPADGYFSRWNFQRVPAADSIPEFRLTEKILARFARRVHEDGARFVVFAAGFAQQEDRKLLAENLRDPGFDADKTQRWLLAVGARNHFEVVPLTPAFRAASAALDRPLWFGVGGKYGHWNATGHAVAARAMADYFGRAGQGPDSPRQ